MSQLVHTYESVTRVARKAWACAGDGSTSHRHAPGCPREIRPGDTYVEYLGEAPAYQSGTRHTIACAVAFLGVVREGA